MATFTSYTSPFSTGKGKENLEARINLLSQMETPFYSSIGRGTTSTPSPQLIEEELNNVVQNAQSEGFDFPAIGSETPVVAGDSRRTYETQIFNKTVRVTGTQQANNTVSVTGKKELAEQLALRGMEMKRDVEWACVGDKTSSANQAAANTGNDNMVLVSAVQSEGYVAGQGGGTAGNGNDGTGRQITDYWGQVARAVCSLGASPTAPLANQPYSGLLSGFSTARTGSTAAVFASEGTARALAESQFNEVARLLYASGGLSYNMGNSMVKNANVILLSPTKKVTFDGILDAKSNNRRDIGAMGSMIGASYTKYGSSFGDFMIVPDQFITNSRVAMYNPQNWKWVTLRQMHTQEIAKIGDSERRQLVMEGTLIHRHTDASGAIAALTNA